MTLEWDGWFLEYEDHSAISCCEPLLCEDPSRPTGPRRRDLDAMAG